MVRPTRRGRLPALLTGQSGSRTVDGDDVSWDGGGFTPPGGSLTVEEVDGAPSASPVDTIRFHQDDFTVTDDGGGQVTITADEPDAAAHIADSSDAHDASAISIADSGGYFTGTDVEAALQELGLVMGGGGMTNPMTTAGDIIVGGASGTPTRLAAGSTSGHVLTSNGSGVAPSWQAVSGGGGLSASFVGKNAIGASWQVWTGSRIYCKKVTLSATSELLAVQAYLRPSTDGLGTLVGIVTDDNSNAPGKLLGFSGNMGGQVYLSNSSSMPGAGRWVSLPIGATLPAGDYWICIASGHTVFSIAYDGSGSDQYFTASGPYATGAYPSAWAITTSSQDFSIRARILS